jgi:hypothetical protein
VRVPSATFLGTSPRFYPQYLGIDPLPAGTTLAAEPLNTYQIVIADAWDIGGIPGDGLWGAAPRGLVGFTSTPGFAVIGGLAPGFPGFSQNEDAMETVSGPLVATATVHPPAVRVVRGRGRKLRPAPRRRKALTAGWHR